MRAAGVRDEQVTEEAAALASLYAPIREDAERAGLSLGQARNLLSALTSAEMERDRRLRELRSRYETKLSAPEVHLRWQEIAGRVEVRTVQDLDHVLAGVREHILTELDKDAAVIID